MYLDEWRELVYLDEQKSSLMACLENQQSSLPTEQLDSARATH